ncbi:hypothetical protein GCM10020218_090770 [Dactylosporangium vinaceum]
MLSRIAESLFWIGRYIERADDTARILDAFLGRLLEDPWADEDGACRSLMSILGAPDTAGPPPHDRDVLELLAFDAEDPERDIRRDRGGPDNARGVRETISQRDVGVPQRHLAHARLPPGSRPSASGRRCS